MEMVAKPLKASREAKRFLDLLLESEFCDISSTPQVDLQTMILKALY